MYEPGMKIQHGDFIEYIDLNGRSPLLGRVRSIFRNDTTSTVDEKSMGIGIEPIICYSELPPNLQSKYRQRQGDTGRVVWLDERQEIEVKPFQVCGPVQLRFVQEADIEEDDSSTKIIHEIIYQHRGKGKASVRNVRNRHLLPVEVHRPNPPPLTGIRVLKIFIDIYWTLALTAGFTVL